MAKYIGNMKVYPKDFDASWFNAMIKHGELVATYDAKHFSKTKMRALAAEPMDGIPPVPAVVP